MLDYNYVDYSPGDYELWFGGRRVVWDATILADPLRQALTEDDYLALLTALLPQGPAWSREPGSTLMLLMAAFASEFARVDARSVDLVNEDDPRLTVQLLPEWERMAGLPDACMVAPQTLQERRAALVARVTAQGGQSTQFFIDLASRLGYSITIEEFKTEASAISAGIPYTGTGWAYTWRVHAPAQSVRAFRVGQSAVGERLRTWGNDLLECALSHVQPAHTVLLFAYA